ncbi:HTH-type transcriptional activator AllS [Budvicia aquatica]|uniref:HTH-type transcriptional activator AllS n=1 Tax=Budvicia aquatica TaxID=82979 RepID=A0A484ZA35_9GAMM|nr:HTH-type transcriptional activator AllS [Budvicia aquatica]
MRYSPEALVAFVEAAALGSFSAAARKLRKSQSTISTAISNLEADLGLVLFDREARHPVLTSQGLRVLNQVKDILAASQRLDELAIRLSTHVEPRLTFVLSDIYQPTRHEEILFNFEQRYPDIEFECLLAEDEDVIDLLQSGRASIGFIEAQKNYPPISAFPECMSRLK